MNPTSGDEMKKARRHNRKGAYAVLTAFLLLILIGVLAWVIDTGWVCLTKTQLQATADASALAGGTELLSGLGLHATRTPSEVDAAVRPVAVDYASRNRAGDRNSVFVASGRDIQLGSATINDATGRWEFNWGATPYNAVQVWPKRNVEGSGSGDGPLPLFFAPVLGMDTSTVDALATAVILPASGFYVPPGDPRTAPLLPFAFEYDLWDKYWRAVDHFKDVLGSDPSLIDLTHLDDDGTPLYYTQGPFGNPHQWVKQFDDRLTWDDTSGVLTAPDGILETSIFPISQTAGNYGTVDIGASNNSTQDLVRQILYGPNADDFAYFPDSKIEPTIDDPMSVNGDTGVSAGIQSALTSIIGECRAIFLFSTVANPGNNAQFEIVDIIGVRIMEITLHAGEKTLVIQPCTLSHSTGIPGDAGDIDDNTTIFTNLILAQ